VGVVVVVFGVVIGLVDSLGRLLVRPVGGRYGVGAILYPPPPNLNERSVCGAFLSMCNCYKAYILPLWVVPYARRWGPRMGLC
jgi:hypothetical protein